MHMNMTRFKRSARRMSALAALLAGAVSVVAMAAPGPAAKKESPAPVVKKSAPAHPAAPVSKKDASASVAKKGVSNPDLKKELAKFVARKESSVTLVSAIDPPSIYLVPFGESKVYRFAQPIKRIAVGDPKIADYIMLNNSEIYLLGKKVGSTNLAIWDQNGNLTSTPLQVSHGTASLQAMLKVLFPKENDIHILAVGPAMVLSGSVSDAVVSESISRLVTAYRGGSVPRDNPESALIGTDPSAMKGIIGENNNVKTPVSVNVNASSSTTGPANAMASGAGADSTRGVVNLLRIRNSQQVRLEICIAQVSKKFLDTFGVGFFKYTGLAQGGTLTTGIVSGVTLDNFFKNNALQVAADNKPSLFRVLAEPTLVTMSGKEGFFLVGGQIYVPVGITMSTLYPMMQYEPQLYGVGLRFRPVVLDGSRISLKVVAEFSEPEQGVILAGTGSTWPAFKLSTVSTNVQVSEGENLVIGGLKLDKVTHSIEQVPLLGEIPILGALFRDAKKEGENTELMVIVRPSLVTSSVTRPELPTDRVISPTPGEFFIGGKLEGSPKK
jgi:pilus assembly protein CpaC